MNIVMYVAIICCTSYIGFGLADYYVKREKFFYELTVFCERLKTDISFLLMPLKEILQRVETEYSSVLVNIAGIVREEIELGTAITADKLYQRFASKYISEDERVIISSFFSILGKSDSKTQLDNIAGFHERFAAAEQSCKAEKLRLAPMCRKLGFLFGIVICLFII